MDRQTFENRMKDKMQEQQFAPREDLWQKLQADLQQPVAPARKALVFVPWMKIAASVALILSVGGAITFFATKNTDPDVPAVAVTKPAAGHSAVEPPAPDQTPMVAETTATTIARQDAPKAANGSKAPQQKVTGLGSVKKQDEQAPQLVRNKTETPQSPVQVQRTLQDAPKTIKQERGPQQEPHVYYADNRKSYNTVNLGMAANVGRSTISNVGYQVGVVGRGNLSKRVFVEAGVLLASNTVNNSSTHSFSGVELGTDGLGLSNTETKTTNKVQANYARNIISVGVTPSVGVKLTKRLSLSTGGAIYRNLNPTLELTNGASIESTALTNDIISTSQQVSTWDLGLTANADYKVTRNLSLNVNYRKGLTDYLLQDTKYIKNSGVQVGLKFLFGK